MIREAYSPDVRKAIRAEVAKDLVKLPVHEIENQLFASNPVARVPAH
jgi:protein required for attachment to host cells